MRRIRIRRFREREWEEVWDDVAEEGFLELQVEGGPKIALACTPKDVKALVLGHLLGQGLIRTLEEVREYREEWDFSSGTPGEVAQVTVRLAKKWADQSARVVWSSCAGERPNLEGCQPFAPRPLFSAQEILSLPARTEGHIQAFRRTGAYHYAFLLDRALKIVAVGEDIGRHNAADKAIGQALLAGHPLGESLLFLTGRITAEMAVKAIRAGIPLLVSQGAALLGAVHLARGYNLGLIGFLRGRRFNLYAGEAWLKG